MLYLMTTDSDPISTVSMKLWKNSREHVGVEVGLWVQGAAPHPVLVCQVGLPFHRREARRELFPGQMDGLIP